MGSLKQGTAVDSAWMTSNYIGCYDKKSSFLLKTTSKEHDLDTHGQSDFIDHWELAEELVILVDQ